MRFCRRNGALRGCLRTSTHYDETTAWQHIHGLCWTTQNMGCLPLSGRVRTTAASI
jgi:hypothetical protein